MVAGGAGDALWPSKESADKEMSRFLLIFLLPFPIYLSFTLLLGKGSFLQFEYVIMLFLGVFNAPVSGEMVSVLLLRAGARLLWLLKR